MTTVLPPVIIDPPLPAYQSPAHAETRGSKPDTVPQIDEPLPPYSGRSPEIAYSPRPYNPRGAMGYSANISAGRDLERGPYPKPYTPRSSGASSGKQCVCFIIVFIFVAIVIGVVVGILQANAARNASSSYY